MRGSGGAQTPSPLQNSFLSLNFLKITLYTHQKYVLDPPHNRQTQITIEPPPPLEKFSGFVHLGSTFAGMYRVLLIVFKVGGGALMTI